MAKYFFLHHPHSAALQKGRTRQRRAHYHQGGVAFLNGTLDYYVRAYDVRAYDDRRKLWEDRLPAGGQATPMTCWLEKSQRQFVVVIVEGHGSTGTEARDSIIAYALPSR